MQKPIQGFDGYLISERGEVFSIKSNRTLTPHLNENGYLYITLRKDNRNRSLTVHRLVAEAFIPNPDNKPFVNHIDANRSNPHKDNLEWCTQTENIKHAYAIGNMSQKKNFTDEELSWLLTQVIEAHTPMTHLAEQLKVGLSRLTINLRNHAHRTGRVQDYEEALKEQKRLRNTAANANKQKPVVQRDFTGKELARFPSATAAARALSKSTSGPICNVLNPNNAQRSAYGYLWTYE